MGGWTSLDVVVMQGGSVFRLFACWVLVSDCVRQGQTVDGWLACDDAINAVMAGDWPTVIVRNLCTDTDRLTLGF